MIKKTIISIVADQINYEPTEIKSNSMLYGDLNLDEDEI